jgi:hypothetical protein
MKYRNPISGCSKAPWGLSVLSRVTSIFTDTTISPGMLLRQCPNHYAIRAGQNLPDKEFRYLRTVIVTAAVYWGLSSLLRLRLQIPVTFQHRAGVSPYTSSFDLAETCVFAKQLLGPFLCGSAFTEHPFSRTYGVNLPSSLTTLLPFVLGFSPHLPVSVCGTGTCTLDSGFSRQCGICCFATLISLPIRPSNRRTVFPVQLSTSLGHALPVACSAYPPVSPLLSIECR